MCLALLAAACFGQDEHASPGVVHERNRRRRTSLGTIHLGWGWAHAGLALACLTVDQQYYGFAANPCSGASLMPLYTLRVGTPFLTCQVAHGVFRDREGVCVSSIDAVPSFQSHLVTLGFRFLRAWTTERATLNAASNKLLRLRARSCAKKRGNFSRLE
jgi:hypothetical protein